MIYRGGGIKPNKDEQIDIELYCRVNLQSLLAYNSKSAFHNIRVLCDTILVFARQVNNPLLIKMHDRCLKQMQDYDVDAKTTEAERREYFKNLIALINYFCNSIGQYTVKAYTDAGSVAGNHVSKYLFKAIMGEPEQLKQMVKDILNGLSLTQASTKYGLIVEHVKICFYRIVGSLFLLERDFTNMAEPDNLQAVRKSKQRYLDMLDLVGQVAEKAA
ncbi:hypothetical protein PL75_03435 [Neisseria arctica]|uniref:Uncharacterized protein n=1 Tax=Neisseria arctica TaxID=1470200 RepID=A0A0J0YT65_9NEIS|nr:hypothetical protein [Neisseria arctica]KLT73286.1 hypothetical protein PL75_03435 [Neisseria arctica]UOO87452.1 hypothetical protein LVJ86_04205 [Neisseria arctica]